MTLYVFIDESGDLGFGNKATNYFITSFVLIRDKAGISAKIRKLLKRLHRMRRYSGGELRFSNSNEQVRKYCLREFCSYDFESGVIIVDKRKTAPRLRSKQNILYNYLIVHNVIKTVLPLIAPKEEIVIYIDKSLSEKNREEFNKYVNNKASWIWHNELENSEKLKPVICNHEDSQKEPLLQLADFICGAVFQKYERNNTMFYNIIKSKIAYEIVPW